MFPCIFIQSSRSQWDLYGLKMPTTIQLSLIFIIYYHCKYSFIRHLFIYLDLSGTQVDTEMRTTLSGAETVPCHLMTSCSGQAQTTYGVYQNSLYTNIQVAYKITSWTNTCTFNVAIICCYSFTFALQYHFKSMHGEQLMAEKLIDLYVKFQ